MRLCCMFIMCLLIGCGTLETGSEIKLINGSVVSVPYIVELSPVGCTGTIIGPHSMITAGHCYGTGSKASFKYRGKKYTSQVLRHPNYNDRTVAYDVAIGHVTEEMPGPFASIYITPYNNGAAVQLYGYGCIKPRTWWGGGANGADGKLRTGLTKIISSNSMEFVTRGGQNGSALCFGDSGGPVMAPSTKGLIGINSRGNIRDTSFLQRIDTVLPFIENYAAGSLVNICGVTNSCE
jgi:hypothetical protein